MFTGIIETLGTITSITQEAKNTHLTIESSLSNELKIDQSVAHNGICLTVTAVSEKEYSVTAIEETIRKTNISTYQVGDVINLERAMILGARLDGHLVQGHVDSTAFCTEIINQDGSNTYTFQYPEQFQSLVIEKGSICVNGVSLTAFNCTSNMFTVAIIPYTLEHTNIQSLSVGATVNIEYDIIGKYILKQQTTK
jgi:riboflavin synthase